MIGAPGTLDAIQAARMADEIAAASAAADSCLAFSLAIVRYTALVPYLSIQVYHEGSRGRKAINLGLYSSSGLEGNAALESVTSLATKSNPQTRKF